MAVLDTRPIVAKIRDSLAGLTAGLRTDKAVRNQMIFSGVAVLILLTIRPPIAWALASLILLAFGLAIELINGAIEAMLDRLHPAADPSVGTAKDMSAAAAFVINAVSAAVLICAVGISVTR